MPVPRIPGSTRRFESGIIWKLARDGGYMRFAGNGVDSISRGEWRDPLGGELQERSAVDERQKKFWPACAAERPEARARATGGDNGIEISVHGVRIEAPDFNCRPIARIVHGKGRTMPATERCLVLASGSPRRFELLGQLVDRFTVIVSGVPEPVDPSLSPVRECARNRAGPRPLRSRAGIQLPGTGRGHRCRARRRDPGKAGGRA